MEKIKILYPRWASYSGLLATAGMVEFADGNPTMARTYFESALRQEADGDQRTRIRVAMHWVFEEAIHGLLGIDSFGVVSARLDQAMQELEQDVSLLEEWRLMRADASVAVHDFQPKEIGASPLETLVQL